MALLLTQGHFVQYTVTYKISSKFMSGAYLCYGCSYFTQRFLMTTQCDMTLTYCHFVKFKVIDKKIFNCILSLSFLRETVGVLFYKTTFRMCLCRGGMLFLSLLRVHFSIGLILNEKQQSV